MIIKKSSGLFFLLLVIISILPLTAKPKYVTTIYPLKAIMERITGDRGNIICILPPGSSPHSFEVSPSVVRETESADAIFYVGKDLDEWIIKTGDTKKIEILNMIPGDSLQNIFALNPSGDKMNAGIDPHFWTDPQMVKILLPSLVNELCRLDPGGCNIYKQNSDNFSSDLDILTKKVSAKLSSIKNRSVFLSHPFFQYYLHRFNFRVEAVIEPYSGREPTPKELQKIIEFGKKKKVSLILNNIQHQDAIAELVSESTGIPLLIMDNIGGVENRMSYEEIIIYNTELLVKVLK